MESMLFTGFDIFYSYVHQLCIEYLMMVQLFNTCVSLKKVHIKTVNVKDVYSLN